jgi:hypothetical protein
LEIQNQRILKARSKGQGATGLSGDRLYNDSISNSQQGSKSEKENNTSSPLAKSYFPSLQKIIFALLSLPKREGLGVSSAGSKSKEHRGCQEADFKLETKPELPRCDVAALREK